MDIFVGWGPQDPCPLDLSKMDGNRLSNIAIMFGGVGDGSFVSDAVSLSDLSYPSLARHLYGSLIGLRQAYVALPVKKRTQLRVHMTLLDIHPTILARDLCILMLTHQLNTPELTAIEKTEIHATIMYTYTCIIMPDYCFDRQVTLHTLGFVLSHELYGYFSA